jgi:hypothetical protein
VVLAWFWTPRAVLCGSIHPGGAVAQQGSPPHRPGRLPTTSRRDDSRATGRDNSWEDLDDEEYPPWAGPAVGPRWADHEERQRRKHGRAETGPGSEAGTWEDAAPDERRRDDARPPDRSARGPGFRRRMAAARSKRRSRITWVWGGAAIAVAVIVAGLLFLGGSPAPKTSIPGLVTTYQAGELKSVPNVCTAVTSAILGQYLPGNRHMVAPHSLDGSAQSLCNWTLDAPPVYRVLEVTVQAYAPSALATGNGSATLAATDAYQQALQAKQHPARDTHLPAARVTPLRGLGTTAFAALQVVRVRGASTDLETVIARDHNVLVTVVFQGPHTHTGKYGPVSPAQLQAGATAAANDIVSGLH